MEQEPKVYIQINKHEPTKIDTQHENFEDLLICVKNDINVLLAGSGKTTGAHNVAKALDLNYASISVERKQESTSFWLIDANGNFVETEFYKIFKTRLLF
jgi:hypothetical protein